MAERGTQSLEHHQARRADGQESDDDRQHVPQDYAADGVDCYSAQSKGHHIHQARKIARTVGVVDKFLDITADEIEEIRRAEQGGYAREADTERVLTWRAVIATAAPARHVRIWLDHLEVPDKEGLSGEASPERPEGSVVDFAFTEGFHMSLDFGAAPEEGKSAPSKNDACSSVTSSESACTNQSANASNTEDPILKFDSRRNRNFIRKS